MSIRDFEIATCRFWNTKYVQKISLFFINLHSHFQINNKPVNGLELDRVTRMLDEASWVGSSSFSAAGGGVQGATSTDGSEPGVHHEPDLGASLVIVKAAILASSSVDDRRRRSAHRPAPAGHKGGSAACRRCGSASLRRHHRVQHDQQQ
jgi:hypothetical protein